MGDFMGAYNCMRLDFIDGKSQYRFYNNPIAVKDYMYGEKSMIESDRIDKKIENHICTPFGYGDVVDDIKVLTPLELEKRHQHSVVNSLNRTKNMIYNYARGNRWEWFITLTFSKDKVDRYDYKECSTKLRKWLNNMRSKYAPDLKYLIVPEQHKDGAWHFHGLLSNTGNLKFNKALNKHTALPLFTKSGLQIFNFGNYKMGYSTATAITDTSKASSYITKYITKDLVVATKGHRRYYPSSNLNLPQKSFFFLIDSEKCEFIKLNKNRITFNKDVKVKYGSFENSIKYIEMDWVAKDV